jgi:hypothetical protein
VGWAAAADMPSTMAEPMHRLAAPTCHRVKGRFRNTRDSSMLKTMEVDTSRANTEPGMALELRLRKKVIAYYKSLSRCPLSQLERSLNKP